MALRLFSFFVIICAFSSLANAQIKLQIRGDSNYKFMKNVDGAIGAVPRLDGSNATLTNLGISYNSEPNFWYSLIVHKSEISNIASKLCGQINEVPGQITTSVAYMVDQIVPAIDKGGLLVDAAFETPDNSFRAIDSVECHSTQAILCTVVNRSTRKIVSENCRLSYNSNTCTEAGINIKMDPNMSKIDVSFNGVNHEILPTSNGYAELVSIAKVGPYYVECGELSR